MHHFYIHTIPSNLLVGDISLGVEHIYKTRLSHEFQAYLKCFNSVFLNYNKGFRFNYQIKYNFINRRYFRMSANLSASYKEAGFKNKQDYWFENKYDGGDIRPTYMMNRELKQLGIGGGIGLNFKLSKHFFIGSDLLIELCKTKKSYTVFSRKNPISNGAFVPFNEPYVYKEQTFSDFIYALPVINFKLSYLF